MWRRCNLGGVRPSHPGAWLAVTGGFVSHTDVAGLTPGGGIGRLTRKAGLSCDNLQSAEVVTAAGQIITAPLTSTPIYSGRSGVAAATFGVVTRFDFGLHEVGPLVNLSLFFCGLDRGTEALPSNTGSFIPPVSAPPAPFVPEK